jgi:hypothetical protein
VTIVYGKPAAESVSERTGEVLETMNKISLDAVAREQLRKAAASKSGRSAETVCGFGKR